MQRISEKIIYPELSYLLCGLCFVTHNQLGRFRSERQYGDFLERLLQEHNVSYQREIALPGSFPGEQPNRNKPDFIVDDKLILELKAKRIITKEDYFQMKRYLVSSEKRLGLIINFRTNYVSIKRVLNPDFRHS